MANDAGQDLDGHERLWRIASVRDHACRLPGGKPLCPKGFEPMTVKESSSARLALQAPDMLFQAKHVVFNGQTPHQAEVTEFSFLDLTHWSLRDQKITVTLLCRVAGLGRQPDLHRYVQSAANPQVFLRAALP